MSASATVHSMAKARSKAAASAKSSSDGNSREARLARAYAEMESALCDIHYMANIASGVVEDILDQDHSGITGRKEFYFVPEQQANTTLFAVYHLEEMIERLKEAFYATLEADDADVGASS